MHSWHHSTLRCFFTLVIGARARHHPAAQYRSGIVRQLVCLARCDYFGCGAGGVYWRRRVTTANDVFVVAYFGNRRRWRVTGAATISAVTRTAFI